MQRASRVIILSTLVAVISLNIIDRQIIAILAEPIKRDLALTDTQLGLLTGLAFSLFYSIVGIPIARYADRGDRVRLLAAATLAWSLMTGLGAAAVSYVTLLLTRAGVAVGEAGCNPTTQSLLADYFPPERRGLAQGILVTAIPISSLLALVLGGLVADRLGWRWTLVVVAIPGVLLAPLILKLLPEPRRAGGAQADRRQAGLRQDVAALLGRRELALLIAAATVSSVQSYAMLLWAPSFFIRSFGWSLSAAGVWLGLSVGIGGVIGSLVAGRLADKLRSRGAGAQILISALVAAATVPILLAMLGGDRAEIAIGAFFVLQAVSVASSPALYAALQDFAPPANRALAFALLSLCANLVGMGLGPVLLGAVSDALQPVHGDQSLRLALLLCVATQAVAALLYGLTYRAAARSHARQPVEGA